jgi:hypothetical protein
LERLDRYFREIDWDENVSNTRFFHGVSIDLAKSPLVRPECSLRALYMIQKAQQLKRRIGRNDFE